MAVNEPLNRKLRMGLIGGGQGAFIGRVHCTAAVLDNRATLVAGALVLIATVALPFASLLRLSTTLTLLVFVLVSLSLWRPQRRAPRQDLPFHAPRWVPVAATFGSIGLIAAQWALE